MKFQALYEVTMGLSTPPLNTANLAKTGVSYMLQQLSPYHSQSNGLAEKSVQIVKCLLNKARKDSTDPYLGLLECRKTPIDNVGLPAQLSMSHQLRSVMPTTSQHFKPTVIEPNVVVE